MRRVSGPASASISAVEPVAVMVPPVIAKASVQEFSASTVKTLASTTMVSGACAVLVLPFVCAQRREVRRFSFR